MCTVAITLNGYTKACHFGTSRLGHCLNIFNETGANIKNSFTTYKLSGYWRAENFLGYKHNFITYRYPWLIIFNVVSVYLLTYNLLYWNAIVNYKYILIL